MMLYGAAYYPEQRDPSRWAHDLDLMRAAGINALRVGEFAWRRFEPSEGVFDFSWMDRFRDLAAERGISLLMCVPLRTPPAWLVEKCPSVRLEREDGVILEFGSRYSFCINNPYLRERGAIIAEQIGRRYGADPAVAGWHIDNEHGDEPDCHCQVCTGLFRDWLKEKYNGDISALNRAWGLVFWGLEFDHFGQIPTPRISKTHHSPGHTVDWRRFRSFSTIQALKLQADAVRRFSTGQKFVTTNNQPSWNGRTDYYDMAAQATDAAGMNYYPPFGSGNPMGVMDGLAFALCRSFHDGRPFQIHELRCGAHIVPGRAGCTPHPGEVSRLAMHGIASGANAEFFFRWRACPFGIEQSHGSITDYDGRPTRIYQEVSKVGNWIKKYGEEISRTAFDASIGVFMDYQTRWSFEATPPEWGSPPGFYTGFSANVFKGVREAGFSADAVSRRFDWSRYKMVIIPALSCCDDSIALKIEKYVMSGGTAVMFPQTGWKDADSHIFDMRMHPVLRRLIGFSPEDFATLGQDEKIKFDWNENVYSGSLLVELPKPAEGVIPDGSVCGEWYEGAPMIIRRRTGSGTAVFIATFPDISFMRDFFLSEAARLQIPRIIPDGTPSGIDMMERVSPDGTRYCFVLSCLPKPSETPIPYAGTDIYGDRTVSGQVNLPPYGVAVIRACQPQLCADSAAGNPAQSL